jgi:ribosomal protein L37AE/L43A
MGTWTNPKDGRQRHSDGTFTVRNAEPCSECLDWTVHETNEAGQLECQECGHIKRGGRV